MARIPAAEPLQQHDGRDRVDVAPAGSTVAAATQALSLVIVALGALGAAGVPLPAGSRAAGSVLLLLTLALFTVAAVRIGRQARGARRWLFLCFAASSACSALAQTHNVVRYVLLGARPVFPSPGLLVLLLASHPLMLLGLAGALGGRRRTIRLETAIDTLLLVTAAAVVGLQLAALVPWPVGAFPDPAQLLLLAWRALPVAELCLTILLVATRYAELGRGASVALTGGVLVFTLANLLHGRLALVDQTAAVASTDVLWALAMLGFVTAVRARPGAADQAHAAEAAGDAAPGLRPWLLGAATLVCAQAVAFLGLRGGPAPSLAAALVLFLLLLAARGMRELLRHRRRAADLAGSIAAERAVTLTLEHRVAERTSELAEAQRVLQRMWVLGQQVTQELQPARVVECFMEAVRDVARVDAAALALVADERHLRVAAIIGATPSLQGRLVPIEGSAMERVLRERRSWQTSDVGGLEAPVLRAFYEEAGRTLGGALAAVPVQGRGACLGVLVLVSFEHRVLAPDELARLEAMTDLLSIALANAEVVESLQQAEWRFRTLFRAAPDAVLTLQEGGVVQEANDCAGDVFGLAPAVLAGRALGELVVAEDRDALSDALATGLGGRPARVDVRVPRQGGVRHVEIALRRLPETEPPTVLLIGRDVTHEHDMHARLVEAERLAAVGELVAGVAHEVNNPLSSISAFAQLLLRDGTLTPDQHESVEVVHAEALRASQVVRDLLTFARRSAPTREAVELAAVVERALRLRGYQLASQNVRTELDLDPDVPPVSADARQLQQVVLNLVTNALQAMPDGGVLRVATRRRDTMVELAIADTGPGIPEEARSHIFEPFFTTKGEGEGTGLGLSVSYGIVAAHGGSLTLADTSAQGTCFVVALPVAPADAAPDVLDGPCGGGGRCSPLRGRRLLFVDDEPTLRSGVEAFGRMRGFDVVTAADGRAALEAVETASFDAVVCDLRMPVMDGVAFYRALRASRPGLASRVVMVTGDTLSGQGRFDATGPVTLAKPFTFEQLEEALETVLRGAATVGRPR
ncbi:MAG TPA: ATP-binding protein [Gemmatimonadaceae bacterium]|nr:ATP-binding protein [Gemmatimonadaceae bacterium]